MINPFTMTEFVRYQHVKGLGLVAIEDTKLSESGHIFPHLVKTKEVLQNEPNHFKRAVDCAISAVSSLRETAAREAGLVERAKKILRGNRLIVTNEEIYKDGLTDKLPKWCVAICGSISSDDVHCADGQRLGRIINMTLIHSLDDKGRSGKIVWSDHDIWTLIPYFFCEFDLLNAKAQEKVALYFACQMHVSRS